MQQGEQMADQFVAVDRGLLRLCQNDAPGLLGQFVRLFDGAQCSTLSSPCQYDERPGRIVGCIVSSPVGFPWTETSWRGWKISLIDIPDRFYAMIFHHQ